MTKEDQTLRDFLIERDIGEIEDLAEDTMREYGHDDISMMHTEIINCKPSEKRSDHFYPALIVEYLFNIGFTVVTSSITSQAVENQPEKNKLVEVAINMVATSLRTDEIKISSKVFTTIGTSKDDRRNTIIVAIFDDFVVFHSF